MTVVVLFSDTHCGSTVGLFPKDGFDTDGGQHIAASLAQVWLWEQWEQFWIDAQTLSNPGEAILGIVVGDAVEGLHHNTTQVVSPRIDEHERIFLDCVDGVRSFVTDWFVVRGTPAHTTSGAQSEERIARDLGAIPEGPGRHSHYRLRLNVEGVLLDVAHHRFGSHRAWTRGNPLRIHVLETIFASVDRGLPVPDLVIRAHQHRFEQTTATQSRRVQGLGLGAWQLKTEYVSRVAPDDLLADIGGWAIVCRDGKYGVHCLEYLPNQGAEAYRTWTHKN